MGDRPPVVRQWVKWLIAGVWVVTAIVILILTQTHAPTAATITLHTREISMSANPALMLNAADKTQFSLSGPAKLSVVAKPASPQGATETVLNIDAPTAASSCTFYYIRTQPLRMADLAAHSAAGTALTLLWPEHADNDSLVLLVRQNVSGSLSAARGENERSSFVCSGVSLPHAVGDTLQGPLSQDAATSFRTYGNVQLTFHELSSGSLEANLRVKGRVRAEHVDPLQMGHETATLLEPLPGEKNEVIFDEFSNSVELNTRDLVEIQPGDDFYVRRLIVNNGIGIELHGVVNELRVGALTS